MSESESGVTKSEEELKRVARNARLRDRWHNDPAYRKRVTAANNRWYKKHYVVGSKYYENKKAKFLARKSQRYHSDPAYRKKTIADGVARHRRRYRSDPEYRKRRNAAANEWTSRKYKSDPEFRRRLLARSAARRARLKSLASPPPLLALLATSQVIKPINTTEPNG